MAGLNQLERNLVLGIGPLRRQMITPLQ
jgi:hypothetical protein